MSHPKLVQKLLADPIFESVLAGAATAVAVNGDMASDVLKMPDMDLGRLLKDKIAVLLPVMQRFQAGNEPAAPESDESLGYEVSVPRPRGMKLKGKLDMAMQHEMAMQERTRMVEQKRLLNTEDMIRASGLQRQTLTKAVTSGRMFTVKVGPTTYYPSFYAHSEIDPKVLGSVTRKLVGLPGWLKLDFFESKNGALGNRSPLDALLKGKIDEVAELAEAYGEDAADVAKAARSAETAKSAKTGRAQARSTSKSKSAEAARPAESAKSAKTGKTKPKSAEAVA